MASATLDSISALAPANLIYISAHLRGGREESAPLLAEELDSILKRVSIRWKKARNIEVVGSFAMLPAEIQANGKDQKG